MIVPLEPIGYRGDVLASLQLETHFAGRAVRRLTLPYSPSMSDTKPPSGKTWRYHFTRKGGDEIEAGEFPDDDAAIARAQALSASMVEPIIVERYGVVSWHYVDEVDDRP